MTNIGIVGSEFAKFTPEQREKAKALIRELLSVPGAVLVSGRSPLSGIDVWAEEIADELCIPKIIHEPQTLSWSGPMGYKERNMLISRDSDEVHVIAVRDYPPGYSGMRFDLCYHCARTGRPSTTHVKSGGCWTLNDALNHGKRGEVHVID